jgi:hypothetical protein
MAKKQYTEKDYAVYEQNMFWAKQAYRQYELLERRASKQVNNKPVRSMTPEDTKLIKEKHLWYDRWQTHLRIANSVLE